MENKEHALRGWNWGKAEFGKGELAFNVQNRPAFEIPYSEISNTNLAGKSEVAVEFNLGAEPVQNGVNGHKDGRTKNRGRKAAATRDELVEMRFYIPGTVAKNDKGDEDRGSQDEDEDIDTQNAANQFYELLMDKAEIGDVAGDTFATFLDVLHLTPRFVFAIYNKLRPTYKSTEDDSTSTCTSHPFDYAAKHTITRFSTNPLRNFSCCRRMTRPIPSSLWG